MLKWSSKWLAAVWMVAALWAHTDDPAVLLQRAWQLQQEQNYTDAAEAYRAFLRVRPDEVGARSNLGVVLNKLGRYDEAITEYEKADKLDPNDPRIVLNLALAYSKSGRLPLAKERLEWLHQARPAEAQFTLLLADTYLRSGENGKVVDLLNADKNSSELAVAYMLGTALLRMQRIEEGQVQLDKILSRGDSAEARFLLGTRMFESGDYPAAVKEFANAAELNAELPELQSYYGQALLSTGDPDGALQAFQKALALDTNDYRANLGAGEILLQRKRYRESVPLLRQATILRPKSAAGLTDLGHALTALEEWEEARTNLMAAQQLGSSSRVLHEDLLRVFEHFKLSRDVQRERAALAKPDTNETPLIGTEAPLFVLASSKDGQTASLHAFRGKTPVFLVFGSYSCPNFRTAAGTLQRLYTEYGTRLPFFLIYIREAHTGQTWESTRNEREGVTLASAATLNEKREHAAMCSRKLHLSFPALVDGMDGAAERAYSAWPSKAVLVGIDGRVLYSSGLTELEFDADKLEVALKGAIVSNSRN